MQFCQTFIYQFNIYQFYQSMENQTMKKYETPDVSVMAVNVERGYASSSVSEEGVNAVRTSYSNGPDNNQVWS